jgi:hypothetical protein
MQMAARKILAASLFWALALGSSALCPLASARAEPFFFFWDRPERPEPEERPGLTWRQVRGILAREGVRLVGTPHFRGDEIIATGVDREGAQKKLTLDALSGEVLDIQVITGPPRRSRLDERPRDRDDFSPPARPMPPPEHGPHDGDDYGAAQPEHRPAPPPAKSEVPKSEPPKDEAAAPVKKSDDPDSALSPIKPLHPAGAPKVEPLPQQ